MVDVASLVALVVKVTVAVALGLGLLRCASRRSAALRHTIAATTLAAAVVVPVASAWLPAVPVVLTTREVQAPVATPDKARVPFGPAVYPTRPLSPGPDVATVLLVAWAAGASLCLLPALALAWQARRIREEGRAWGTAETTAPTLTGLRRLAIPVLLHDRLSSPVACGVLSPAIALPASAGAWSTLDLERAVAHELAHVRRRDVLVQACARLVCAAYWFHPLVWLCWRTLRVEAERACDDAVLERFEATDYAAQLVRLARAMHHGGMTVGLPTMARPGELTTRVGAILDPRQARSHLNIWRAASSAVLGLAGAAALACLDPTVASAVPATGPPLLRFATASIRESAPGESMAMVRHPDGSVRITATPLRVLVRLAFGVQDDAIVDAPDWMASTRYTIDARPPDDADIDGTLSMMRALLAERFGLRISSEWRQQRVFELGLPASAPGLAPPSACATIQIDSAGSGPGKPGALPRCGFHVTPGRIDAVSVDGFALAATLSTPLGAQVVVRSPGPARFDLRLTWPANDASGLVEALRTQAGATVSEQQRRVPVVAIQSVHRASQAQMYPASGEKP